MFEIAIESIGKTLLYIAIVGICTGFCMWIVLDIIEGMIRLVKHIMFRYQWKKRFLPMHKIGQRKRKVWYG